MADGSDNGNPTKNPADMGGGANPQPQNARSGLVLDPLTKQMVPEQELIRRVLEREKNIRDNTYLPSEMKAKLEAEAARKAANNGVDPEQPLPKTPEEVIREVGRGDIYMPVPPQKREEPKKAVVENEIAEAKSGTSSAALDALNNREKVSEPGVTHRPDTTPDEPKGVSGVYMPAAPAATTPKPSPSPDAQTNPTDPSLTTRALQQTALINDPLSDTLASLDRVPTTAKGAATAQQAGVLNALKEVMGVPTSETTKPEIGQDGKPINESQKQEQKDQLRKKIRSQPTTSSDAPASGNPSVYTPVAHPVKAKGHPHVYTPTSSGESGGGESEGEGGGGGQKKQPDAPVNNAQQAGNQQASEQNAALQNQALQNAQQAQLSRALAASPGQGADDQQETPGDDESDQDPDADGNSGKKKGSGKNPATDAAKKETASKFGSFLKGLGSKMVAALRTPISALGGISVGIILLILLLIVLFISVLGLLDATNDTISQENTTGRSAAFFKYFGAAGGEGNNFLQSLGKPTVVFDGTPLQNVKMVRVQYGLKLNSKAEINRAFGGGSDAYDIEVSQLDLWTKLTVPEGSSKLSFGITEQNFWSKFRAQLPPNYKVSGGTPAEGVTMNFTPSLCDGKTCQYETDYNLTSESSYDPGLPIEAFESGTGVFRVSFGGSVNLTIKRAGQPDEYTSIPIYPSVTVCIDLKNGTTRSCDSPVGDGRSTGGSVGGTGQGSAGGTVDGITCPFDHDPAATGASLVCSNGYSGNHTAVDIQVRSNGGNGTAEPGYTVRAPFAGVVQRKLASYESKCGQAVTVTRTDGAVFYLGHIALNSTITQALELGQQPQVSQGDALGVYFTPVGYVPGDTSGINNRYFTSPAVGDLCWSGPHIHTEWRPDGGLGNSQIFSVLEKSCSTTGKSIVKRPITGICQ